MRASGLFLTIALAALPAMAAKQNVTGKWEFKSTSPIGERSQVVEMTQKDKGLSVSMKTRGGEDVTGKGTVKGEEISWTLSFEGERGPFTVTYTGRIQENGMKGKVSYGRYGKGTWSARKPLARIMQEI